MMNSLFQETNLLDKLIVNLPGIVFWKDINSVYRGCNNRLTKVFGVDDRKEIIGKTDFDFLWSKEEAQRIIDDDKQVISTLTPKYNIYERLPLANGEYMDVLTNKEPLFDDENRVIGLLGVAIDITELKQTQENLKIAKEKAEAANEAKEAFLRNMRHDLRTPFSGILTLAQLMADDETEEEKRENLQDIADSAKVLLEYMNKILDHAQLGAQAKKIISEPIDLEKLLTESLMTITPTADAKGLRLHKQYAANIPKTVISDKWRLQRIVMNLLGNAVKFTDKGSITLGTDIVSQTRDKIILAIWVRDTGIGIPENNYQDIFEKFTRLEAAYTGKYQGTGLGLYDVKQLCRELGGEISVSSKIGKGSTFTFTLPFTKVMGSDVVIVETETKKVTPIIERDLHILLVEDQPIAAMTAARMLTSRGYTVDIAETGFIALDKFNDKNYDLILMDIGLPDINGIQVTKKIRQLEVANGLKKIPIIAVTAHPDMQDTSLKIFDYVFAKPCTDALFSEIEKVLNR